MIKDRSREASGALRFLEYFLTRNIGTLADCMVLWALAAWVFKGSYVGENIIAPTISFEVATMVNYFTSSYWVYCARIDDHTLSAHAHRFVKFNVSSILGYVIKIGLLLVIDHLFGWHVVVCNLVALSIAGMFNFTTSEKWVFGRKAQVPEVLSAAMCDMETKMREAMNADAPIDEDYKKC